jgi:pyruvate/2-oxoglutarate dehydrogenase complex dihydrolipoamide dehydrogenase (E3) component
MTSHDVIVIGMGVGGEEVAGILAEAGMDVVGIERHLVGGECPYYGCIPTKMMLRAAIALTESARVSKLAGDAVSRPDYGPVATRIRDEATDDWSDQVAVDRFENKGGTFVRGEARISGPREVEIDGERLRGRKGIVIAVGGQPIIPSIEGIDQVEYWTNRDAVKATSAPSSMIVLGAGPIGVEIAQAFHRFGTEITFIEKSNHALSMEEPENGEAIGAVLRDEGMTLHTNVSAVAVRNTDGGIAVELADGRVLEGERLLVATGRKANLPDLGLENVGLDPDAMAIEVDPHLRASDGIWAVGDITGKGAFTHMATYQGRIAAADILGKAHTPADYSAVPRVTFTDPEVASVGLTEKQAVESGVDVRVGISKTSSSTRGWIHGPGAENGVVKLVGDGRRKTLVGASIMGPAAGEGIGILMLAIRERIPVPRLRDLIYPYPTFQRGLEESLKRMEF